MGNITSGFVKSTDYKQNSNGTFTCKANILKTDGTSTTVSGSYIGILNVNNIISPNNNNQMMMMSDDNKYIFMAINSDAASLNDYSFIYLVVRSIIYYGISIPQLKDFIMLAFSTVNSPEPNNSTYNSLSKGDRKNSYKGYLLGQNPTAELLKANPDRKVWSDIGYIYKTIYDLNLPDNATIVAPNTFCIKIDSPDVISYASQYDCRSNSSASPVITKSLFSIDSIDSNSYGTIAIVVGVVCCLMCMSGCALMIMMSNKSGKSRKK